MQEALIVVEGEDLCEGGVPFADEGAFGGLIDGGVVGLGVAGAEEVLVGVEGGGGGEGGVGGAAGG